MAQWAKHTALVSIHIINPLMIWTTVSNGFAAHCWRKISRFFLQTGVSSEKSGDKRRLGQFSGRTREVGWDLLAAARALCGNDQRHCLHHGREESSCFVRWIKNCGSISPGLDIGRWRLWRKHWPGYYGWLLTRKTTRCHREKFRRNFP